MTTMYGQWPALDEQKVAQWTQDVRRQTAKIVRREYHIR